MVIEGIPVPLYTRLWQEARALRGAGADVTVICPKLLGYRKGFEEVEGIRIRRHPMPVEARGGVGFLVEYGLALLLEFVLLLRERARGPIDVLHGCSPPDLFPLIVWPFKLLGTRFVYDQHDLTPELYEAKFGRKGRLHKALLLAERWCFRTADYAISANESYRAVALGRGGMPPARVEVVRSGPDLDRIRIGPGDDRHRNGKRHLVGYVGMIGKQDGVGLLMDVVAAVAREREDVHFAVIGDGPELPAVRERARHLKVDRDVTFHGLVRDASLLNEILNTCDVCVNPDPLDAFNDLATTIKVMEYMALAKPVVQFDLKEARVTAGVAAWYARPNDAGDFARLLCRLLDDAAARARMGAFGRQRIETELEWRYERARLVSFYERFAAGREG
jgi:glycosyltransferase involved in cell wall biosynthesis